MKTRQLLAFGVDGRLADLLREVAQARGIWLREVSRPASCLSLLRQGQGHVLVLKLGRDLEQELALLERVTSLFPACVVVVVGPSDHPPLAALAWDLGAHYVSFPPQPVDKLRAVVEKLLDAS